MDDCTSPENWNARSDVAGSNPAFSSNFADWAYQCEELRAMSNEWTMVNIFMAARDPRRCIGAPYNGKCAHGLVRPHRIAAEPTAEMIVAGQENLRKEADDVRIEPDVTGQTPEITDEMINAGVLEYLSFDARFEDYEDVVARIWKAMETAKSEVA